MMLHKEGIIGIYEINIFLYNLTGGRSLSYTVINKTVRLEIYGIL